MSEFTVEDVKVTAFIVDHVSQIVLKSEDIDNLSKLVDDSNKLADRLYTVTFKWNEASDERK